MINEPTPSPSEEGTAVSRSSSSALRFMESPLSFFFRMHWDHEPGRISWSSAAVVEDPAAALWMFPACCGWCCYKPRSNVQVHGKSSWIEQETTEFIGPVK